jgi:threonine dehydrogenase-like Zn-dependent dehydrogenase
MDKEERGMKAIGITPRRAHAARLLNLPLPKLDEIPGGRGVLVQVLQVGLDGTDRELYMGEYGAAPEGDDFLIPGHESFGRVVDVGPHVTELHPGDYVVPTVRRPGSSIYDQIGEPDMTTDDVYRERGINLLHGFLAEYYVEDPDYLVRVPAGLRRVAVLAEPMSIVQKGISQAYDIQCRLKVWQPRRAAVTGASTIGLLATLALRLRGLEVTTFGRTPKPNLNASLLETVGARYLSTREVSVADSAARYGPFDLIFEATGFSPMVFEAAYALAKNGILIMASVTTGTRKTEIESDRFNLEFVLGNKVMFGTVNAHQGHFEAALTDFARAEVAWSGWLSRLLTHPVRGLDNYRDLFGQLFVAGDAIKVYMIVHEEKRDADL